VIGSLTVNIVHVFPFDIFYFICNMKFVSCFAR
jgi:hypothetical protein